jgi:ABC-type dipeptide/oligopeptide/nickel transport system permease subunit
VATPDTVAAGPAARPLLAPEGRLRTVRENLIFGITAVVLLIAIAWPLIVPHSPTAQEVGPPLAAPSFDHPFGTDQFGRDVFSRVLAGTRISIGIGLAATAAALLLGGALGSIAALSGGWRNELIMRSIDVIMAFPGILLAVVLAAALGAGVLTTIVVMTVLYVPAFARVTRAAVLSQKEEDYVTAARLLGSTRVRVFSYHIGINALSPVIVFATTIIADAIVLEAALSFIGVGIPPPSPSWGNIISDGRQFVYAGDWWISTFGGLAIFATVLLFNRLSDVLGRRLAVGSDG